MALAPWEKPWVVRAALLSIERQSHKPLELIISTDGPPTEELRSTISETQIPLVLIDGPGGEGAGPVLQRGLEACKTELVVRADADDINHDTRCERLIRAIQKEPDLAVLGSNITEFTQDCPEGQVKKLCIRAVPVGRNALRRFSRWRNPMNHQSTIMRRTMVMAVGGYRSARGFEDYDLWLRLLANKYELDNISPSLVLARVEKSHRIRRLGFAYIKLEYQFGMQCLKEGLMQPWMAVLWLMMRLPTRLLSMNSFEWLLQRVARNQFR